MNGEQITILLDDVIKGYMEEGKGNTLVVESKKPETIEIKEKKIYKDSEKLQP